MGMKKKDNAKYNKILEAAVQIIMDDGAATLSTTKVAKRVNISQSNIYIYFKNKDDLLKQLYLMEVDCYQQLFDQVAQSNVSTKEKLQMYVKALYDVSVKNPDSMYVIEQIKQIPNSPVSVTDPSFVGFESNPILDLLNQGIAEGILKDVNPTIYLSMIFNTIRMNSINAKQGQQSNSYEDISSILFEGMLK